MKAKYIKGPLNYTGGKHSILNDIIPLFPEKINNFVDLFAGGLNVGININADKIFVNDHIPYLIELYSFFRDTDIDGLLQMIDSRISKYSLNQENVEGYNNLRSYYNTNPTPLDLFVLVCFSFNHQIRFNNNMKFNTPFGKNRSSYNDSIRNNLVKFCEKLKQGNYVFSTIDFRNFDFSQFTSNDVVYCDPPYLITTGSYNDGKRGFGDWKQEEDDALLELLDNLNDKGISFFLSNVFYHKGMSNDKLINWSKKYNVIYIDKTYANCSYHFKDRNAKTVEVLISNYEVQNE